MQTKTLVLSSRNAREILRDPVSMVFGIGLPVVLLFLMNALYKNIPNMENTAFALENFTPGTAIFSLSFVSMFGGMLIAGDKESSFLARLFASPLTAFDFIVGYLLPLLPIALLQIVCCFATAVVLGLPLSINIIWSVVALLPTTLLFATLGLLLGTVLSNKQVGPMASVLVQVVAFCSGTWFDISLIGGVFQTISSSLPFYHALALAKMGLQGSLSGFLPHLLCVVGYTVILFALAVVLFKKKMKN